MTNAPTYIQIGTLVLGSSVMGGLITAAITGLRDSAAKRREGYAKAVRALVARVEYPYRVRRRTSDDPATLFELAKLGHDIQEQLASARIWIHTESPKLAEIFEDAINAINAAVAAATSDAWDQPPISNASEMNLLGWGAGSQDQHIKRFGRAVERRFGWRRFIPTRRRYDVRTVWCYCGPTSCCQPLR
ncbi:hypothetical protein [Mycobacterium sp. 1274756.6]|uniref:hypothetical protein n=1 Tax=Mycobacterium sp. 1274756.6 TaxID=1834076 RepID=UPI0012E6FD52|nr:hypothetical protein [Mycobacterium sp. 1274756.6]